MSALRAKIRQLSAVNDGLDLMNAEDDSEFRSAALAFALSTHIYLIVRLPIVIDKNEKALKDVLKQIIPHISSEISPSHFFLMLENLASYDRDLLKKLLTTSNDTEPLVLMLAQYNPNYLKFLIMNGHLSIKSLFITNTNGQNGFDFLGHPDSNKAIPPAELGNPNECMFVLYLVCNEPKTLYFLIENDFIDKNELLEPRFKYSQQNNKFEPDVSNGNNYLHLLSVYAPARLRELLNLQYIRKEDLLTPNDQGSNCLHLLSFHDDHSLQELLNLGCIKKEDLLVGNNSGSNCLHILSFYKPDSLQEMFSQGLIDTEGLLVSDHYHWNCFGIMLLCRPDLYTKLLEDTPSTFDFEDITNPLQVLCNQPFEPPTPNGNFPDLPDTYKFFNSGLETADC